GLVRESLEEAPAPCRLQVAGDGEKAMALLRRQGEYAGAVRPDLILLDLNLPRKSGRQVLAEIKADEELSYIPVVILTSSRNEEEIKKCYQMHASSYIVKPIKFVQFMDAMKTLERFWSTIAAIPQSQSS